MRKIFLLFLLLNIVFLQAQKKRKSMDITSDLEVRALAVKALGNNTLSKDFGVFYGVGAGGQLMTPTNFGVGIEYNLLFGDVKYGRENYFGNLGSQRLTSIDLSIIHKNDISEDFFIEQQAGFSLYRLNSTLYPGNEKYSEGRGGFHLGAKAVFTIDREGHQQFVFGAKGNAYFSGTNNENAKIEKYYRQSFLVSLSFGYRYHF